MYSLNEPAKKSPVTRNLFFATTLLILILNFAIFAAYGNQTPDFASKVPWDSFSVTDLFHALVNTFTHSNLQHVLLNMLCFAIAGSYLERKMGSLRFLLFMTIVCFFTAFASCTNSGLYWHGFSGANYGLYGYILLEYVFTLARKKTRTPFNIAYGAILIGLIYLAMCFCGGTSAIRFEWYPYDLLHNLGHASGFAVGLLLGICLPPSFLLIEKEVS